MRGAAVVLIFIVRPLSSTPEPTVFIMVHARGLLASSAVLALLIFISGCEEMIDAPLPEVTSVEIDLPETEMLFTETATATARVLDQYGDPMQGVSVSWSSSDPAVASVSGGVITAESMGEATLTATAGGVSDAVALLVDPLIHEVRLRAADVPAYHLLVFDLPADVPAAEAEHILGWVEEADTDVIFASVGDTAYSAIMPDLPSDSYTLWVEFDERGRWGLTTYSTTAAPVISDPQAALDEEMSTVGAAITATRDSALAAGDSVLAAELAVAEEWLSEAAAMVSTASPEERAEAAQMIAAFRAQTSFSDAASMLGTGMLSSSVLTDIRARMKALPLSVQKAVVGIVAFVAFGEACVSQRHVPSCIAAGVAGGLLLHYVKDASASASSLTEEAFKLHEDPYLGSSGSLMSYGMAQAVASVDFTNGVSLDLPFSATYRTLAEQDVGSGSEFVDEFLYAVVSLADQWWELDAGLRKVAEYVGRSDLGMPGSPAAFRDPPASEDRQVPADELSVIATDNGVVSCSRDADAVGFAVVCSTEETEDQEFTISLKHTNDFGAREFDLPGSLIVATASLELASGNDQTAYPGDPLDSLVVVRVFDIATDTAIAGATIEWAVTTGGGTVSASSTTTNADGFASVSWTLEAEEGEQKLQATASMADSTNVGGSPVTFTATADRGAMLQKLDGDGQSADPAATLSNPLVVRVADKMATPVQGVTIEWTVAGGGSLSATSTITDANGEAKVSWTLGSDSTADQSVEAAFYVDGEHAKGSPVTFTTSGSGDLVGTWKLTTIDGESLPVAETEYCTFELHADGSLRIECGGTLDGQPWKEEGTGTWTVTDQQTLVITTYEDGQVDDRVESPFTVQGDVLTLHEFDEEELVFERSS